MYILGLTTLGDSAATLLFDGRVVAAAEEERFSRVKHHIGFPYEAVQYCLDEAGITIADVDHVSLYWKPWILSHRVVQTARALTIDRDMFRARVERGAVQLRRSYLGMALLPRTIRQHFGPSKFRFHYLEHHECHAASAFLVSPFEEAAILTCDGVGEETTTLMARGRGADLHPFKRIKLPHSLGQFYAAMTNFLGFDPATGDEWKVMGLAAFGSPKYYDFLSQRVLTTSERERGEFRFNIEVLDHHLAKRLQFSDELISALGQPRRPEEEITARHQDIAASAQRAVEEVALKLLDYVFAETGDENLCMAGGVGFNSVMNGRIVEESPFRNFYFQPVAGDAGCSLGAAYLTYHRLLKKPRVFSMDHAYFGPGFSSEECATALAQAGIHFETLADEELLSRVAELLDGGAIVGWFQGRMEFGPRALGNRSFLGDPRRADIRETLNHKVKLREWFRPLAPSILEERSTEFFGRPYSDPFMITVMHMLEEGQDKVPAVVHVDGSARPQTVSRTTNPRYWGLIREFERRSGIPMLLNTSFNVQEPIVCSPEDAVRTYQNADFEVLVLENHLVLRSPG